MGLYDDDPTCPMPTPLVADAAENIVGNYSFHQFNMIVSGASTALTCIIMFSLMAMHAVRLSNPNEQIKIMRISALLPLYAIFSFLSVCFPNAHVYLGGWTEYFQGMALYNFLMLLCDFATPDDTHSVYFASLRIPKKKGSDITINGLSWFRRIWFFVLQYPFVAFFVAILQCIAEATGVYCLESKSTHFASIWLNIIQIFSASLAISGVIGFYYILKAHMQEHKPLLKLLAFKIVIGLVFLENIIFLILHTQGVPEPSATMTYADVIIGLPTMIVCIQMVPLALFFLYAYQTNPYRSRSAGSSNAQQHHGPSDIENEAFYQEKHYQGGPFGLYAWFAFLNPLEFFREVKSTFCMVKEAPTNSEDGGGEMTHLPAAA